MSGHGYDPIKPYLWTLKDEFHTTFVLLSLSHVRLFPTPQTVARQAL